MKLKVGGGLAGNNGLKSIRAHLRADGFSRLRIGVGKPEPGTMTGRDWVLKRPARADRPMLEQVVARAADAAEFLAASDIEATMNRFNYWYSTVSSGIHLLVAAYLLWFGVIGIQTWA